ncbi:hypothetical protein WJ47_13115 [Burkholderia ubonensis]|uniref:Rv2525c-like glycoside hydrolase-like domain-containing protein n=2 Tax=Burkholderia cepacia complex TaxID=87882 RepID=A0A103ZK48_9BURK|nr:MULTISPECIES: glycoside hydrolase domain-containing protein [Burkholderia cepacia complex]AOJ64392.1 hypothetical protein WJ32_09900 [Burkholderia ubonensis]AOK18313.1 hypothetical protein WT26_12490 [Burkholderia cepacia]AOK25059.1 hypothetical protein WK67_12430 [Burkholderia ubonensis]KVG52360.1 hypothetical protein WJ33_10215 [Burkholderia ubonensis]KVG73879.1 hypothetical protein WJ34_14740 [Burkholderia ubonensis]
MTFYAGFDIDEFPGLDQLAWLKKATNLSWCGYPLADQWKGRRKDLIKQGWGLLPVYKSQPTDPTDSNPEQQGKTDGEQAADLMRKEGFPRNAYVFIDWKSSSLPDNAETYLRAWVDAVQKNGYMPGVHCSTALASSITSWMDDKAAAKPRIWATKASTDEPHLYSGAVSDFPAKDPAGSGYSTATAWQYQTNAVLMLWTMQVDLSSSTLENPSAPSAS